MLYIITMSFFLLWAIWVIRKGHFSWHSVISIYVISLFIVDFGDVAFDHFINFYDLPAHLLKNPYSDHYMGIVLSDGMIFPLISIVFCYYSVRYHRPWLLSILFAAMLGIIEFCYVHQGFMIYHQWKSWNTPLITSILFRILANFADRFVYYSPPVSYRFRLTCFIYTFSEWPGALMGWGVMLLYQYRPHIFPDYIADDRFTAMILATVMGAVAALLAPKMRQKNKLFLFLALGLASSCFAFWMYDKGWLIYHHWNHWWTIIRYITPYFLIYWYDCWESNYLTENKIG